MTISSLKIEQGDASRNGSIISSEAGTGVTSKWVQQK